MFKHITGRNYPTTFLPLSPKIDAQVNSNKPSVGQYLTGEQANHVYKKTELGEVINTETLQQELEQERQLNRIDDTNRETNPYRELIVNNAEKIETLHGTNETVVYLKQHTAIIYSMTDIPKTIIA